MIKYLESFEETNDVGVANRGQESDLAIQAIFEVPVEPREEDLLQSHHLPTFSVHGFPHSGEGASPSL